MSGYSPAGLNVRVTPIPPPSIFSWVPQQCWPDNIVAFNEAYVMEVDPAAGNALDAQWIDGSTPTAVGITAASGKVWITGFTPGPDVPFTDIPFTSGTLSPKNLGTGFTSGAYVAAVDFSASPAAGAPMLACVLDAGNLEHVRAVAPYQVISLFGTNLGPSTGVAAPDGADASVAGVTATFDGNPAHLQYVSASQINVIVPLVDSSAVMQVTVNGSSTTPRELPLVGTNLNVFADLASNEVSCPGGTINASGFQRFGDERGRLGQLLRQSGKARLHGVILYGRSRGNWGAAAASSVTTRLAGIGRRMLGARAEHDADRWVCLPGGCAIACFFHIVRPPIRRRGRRTWRDFQL